MSDLQHTTTHVDPAVFEAIVRDGFAIVPDVLTADEAAHVLDRLWAAAQESERRGSSTYIAGLDPNASNVRVFNLIELDPVFADLIAHPVADAIVAGVIGANYIISNFSANIARPGSGSMVVHSDLAAVTPEPWLSAQSINIVWCLTDVEAANGATLHLPGSHHVQRLTDLPADPISRMVPFEASAGSIIALEGRMWHTSGRNVTADFDRAMLFGYYTKPHIRPQFNYSVGLSPEVQAQCSPAMRTRLGLDTSLNSPNEAVFGTI